MPRLVKPLAATFVAVKLLSQLRNSTNESFQNCAHQWRVGGLLQVSYRQNVDPLGGKQFPSENEGLRAPKKE